MTRPWENSKEWAPPTGWVYRRFLHSAHACGWTLSHPADDPAGFTAINAAHDAECHWPNDPPLIETASD